MSNTANSASPNEQIAAFVCDYLEKVVPGASHTKDAEVVIRKGKKKVIITVKVEDIK